MAKSEARDDNLPVSVHFDHFDQAWEAFQQMESLDWKHLYWPGSLSEQPEALWNEVMLIASLVGKIRRVLKG